MLVLTRKLHETIVVDDRIEIRVIRVKGNRIRLGIEAPGEVSIRRGELAARESEAAETASAVAD